MRARPGMAQGETPRAMAASRLAWPLGAGLIILAAIGGCAASPDGGALYAAHAHQAEQAGLLRRDFAPRDALFDKTTLEHSFERVVFDAENIADVSTVAPIGAHTNDAVVLKWRWPIRYRLVGDGVRQADRLMVEQLARRLSRYTGLQIRDAAAHGRPNMTIIVKSAFGRGEFLRRLDEQSIDVSNTVYEHWIRSLEIPCAVSLRLHPTRAGVIQSAVVLVKAEIEGVLRESCLHEEITQSLGLTNDHPDVRPSIFNDDGEFARLTAHDVELLRLLYDDDVKAGMNRDEAMPIIRTLLAEDWLHVRAAATPRAAVKRPERPESAPIDGPAPGAFPIRTAASGDRSEDNVR